MGFYRVDYEILDFLDNEGLLKAGGSVLEFGSQDIKEDRYGNVVGGGVRISAKSCYEEYGFSSYQCIDLDGGHDCLQFDLGLDLKTHYGFHDCFDVVTVREIGHWIFDQKQLFINIHNHTKVGGIIIWRSPIVGAFSAGCFGYMPLKILQLGFCNEYLYKGAWIFEQLSGLENARFGSWEQTPAYRFESFKAADFLPLLRAYLNREDCFRCVSLKEGLPLIRLTVVFQKTNHNAFVPPVFPYVDSTIAIRRNAQAILMNCLPQSPRKQIAIFGSKQAAYLALNFADACHLKILCFVDDYKNGDIFHYPIVNWETFVKDFQDSCDFILLGPKQHGDLKRDGLHIPVARLEMEWFC